MTATKMDMSQKMSLSHKMNRAQKQGIATAIICTGFIALAWGLSSPIISQNMERMEGSGALLGWLISLAAVATILSTPFVPKLMSRFKPRHVMIACLVIGAATVPALKIFMTPAAWFLIKFIGSCAFTIVFVIAEIWINQLAPEHLRGRIMGMYGAALAGGMGIGSGLAVKTGIDGWSPFLITAAVNLAAVLPFILMRKATQVKATSKEDARFGVIFKIMRAAPAIMMCGVVFGAIEQSLIYFLPVYDTRLGHSEESGRILLLIAALGIVLFQYPMGVLADKMNRKRLTVILMGVAVIGPIAIVFAGDNFALIATLAFFYAGLTTALYTVGLVRLGETFKGPQLAAANAGFIVSYGIGSLIIPPIAGKMMDVYNPGGFMWALAGLGLVGLVVTVLSLKHGEANHR
ncbi:MAG: MFS transporter [Robiginitomaculum sp.]|nr:MFS transporter [Robiginitomaculum sp.]